MADGNVENQHENPADSRQARPSWPAAAGGTSPGEHPAGASRGRVPGAPHAGRRPHAGAAADTGDATTGTHGTAGVPRPDGNNRSSVWFFSVIRLDCLFES